MRTIRGMLDMTLTPSLPKLTKEKMEVRDRVEIGSEMSSVRSILVHRNLVHNIANVYNERCHSVHDIGISHMPLF